MEGILTEKNIDALASFFDLLAQFDFEDKKIEALEAGSSTIVAVDGVPASDAENITFAREDDESPFQARENISLVAKTNEL